MAFRSTAVSGPSGASNKEIGETVKKAKQQRKIFMLTGGYEPIRTSLVLRGWLEKIATDKLAFLRPNTERLSTALLLKNEPFNFIWQSRMRPIEVNGKLKPYVNSIMRAGPLDYTNKGGMVNCMKHFHWNYIEGVTDLNVQRTFVLGDKSGKEEFFEDFRRTAFTSFLLYLDSLSELSTLFYPKGDISVECIKFSIQKIELLLKIANHEDIDTPTIFDVCAKFPKDQKKTLTEIQLIVSGTKKFKSVSEEVLMKLSSDIRACAEKIHLHWPSAKYDGYRNIWIFKPINSSSGYGIQVTNRENEINDIAHGRSGPRTTFVAQKYIERPLLIHNRKFDMRLYMLTMIKKGHIDVWLYKDCYVKFATSAFNLKFMHKAIHVTNYAVQKYFMNVNDAVPGARENMWTLQQLLEYFEMAGKPRLWDSHIYPAIKKNLLSVVLPSFEHTDLTENNFELNGIDVMITFDYEPVLIEINSVPALFFSKTVQEIITHKLLEDVIKVVVDHSADVSALTGDFECIHSLEIPRCDNTHNLVVTGKTIRRDTAYRAHTAPIVAKAPINVQKHNETMNFINPALFNGRNDARYIYLKSV